MYANIRRGFPGRGRQTTVWLSRTAIFSVYGAWLLFRKTTSTTISMLKHWPALLYGDMQSVIDFSVISRRMTLNDLHWLFRVKCNILKFTQNSLVVLIPYLLTYSQQCFTTTLLTSYCVYA